MGEVFITTAKNAMGLGAPNVVEDEAALIDDQEHSLVMRMLGDSMDNFLVKVGNPWDSGHFRQSAEDSNYYKIVIDWRRGEKEGRITRDFVEEKRNQYAFDVLYECKFPPVGIVDNKGWIPLLTEEEIKKAFVPKDLNVGFGVNKLGVDVGGGGDFSVIVQRYTNLAKKIYKKQTSNTMEVAEAVVNLKKQENIPNNYVFVDIIGLGRGVGDILDRIICGVNKVNVAEKPVNPIDSEQFVNLRAMCYWKLREWILKGGKLEQDDDWLQLTEIKYRTKIEGTKGKMEIIPKEAILAKGKGSPDVVDALALTFATEDIPYFAYDNEMATANASFDPHNPLPEI